MHDEIIKYISEKIFVSNRDCQVRHVGSHIKHPNGHNFRARGLHSKMLYMYMYLCTKQS